MEINKQLLLVRVADCCKFVYVLKPSFLTYGVALAVTIGLGLVHCFPIKRDIEGSDILPVPKPDLVNNFSQNLIAEVEITSFEKKNLIKGNTLFIDNLLVETNSRLQIA